MSRITHSKLKIALTVASVLFVGFFALNRTFYDDAMADAFFSLELGSLAILLLRLSPKWSNAGIVAALTIFIGLIDFRVLHVQPHVMAWFSFLGLASFIVMLARLIWQNDRRLLAYACGTAFVFTASEYFATTFLNMTTNAHPKTLDLYLLLFDGSLSNVQPAFWLGQIYARNPWLHTAGLIGYIGLAVPITMVYAGRLARFGKSAIAALVAFVITGPIGLIFYNIFPAGGPRNLFNGQFPFAPIPHAMLPQVVLEWVKLGGERNGMPSLHLAWTLLAWWYSRRLSRAERVVAFLFLTLTAFATMGTGEHWLADLVVAVPFSLVIQSLCAYQVPLKDTRRNLAFVFGLGATVAWLVLLRYCTRLFWTSPVVPWSLIAGTLALTTLRQRMLEQAEYAAMTAAGAAETSTSAFAARSNKAEATAPGQSLDDAYETASRQI